jgi:hypothetical protein
MWLKHLQQFYAQFRTLHTAEVTGSSPVSPTIFPLCNPLSSYSGLCSAPLPFCAGKPYLIIMHADFGC